MPAAQQWRWRDDAPLKQSTYAPLSELAATTRRSFNAAEASALAEALSAPLRVLSDTFGTIQCPITAGRDSRMLTGLMLANHLPGDFFSAGEEGGIDLVIGNEIAQRFALPHRRSGGTAQGLVAVWDTVEQRVLRQNDGMVTLMHAENA